MSALKWLRASGADVEQKIREVYLASPVEGATLQGLVNSELAAKKKKGTEALFWLTRSVHCSSLRHCSLSQVQGARVHLRIY